MTFTPTDTTDYTTATERRPSPSGQGHAHHHLAAPAAISYGTALSSTQLDATASVPGTFAYTPAGGHRADAGANQTLSVLFTPTDTTDYAATATMTITVTRVTPTVTWSAPAAITRHRARLHPARRHRQRAGHLHLHPPGGHGTSAGANQTLSVLFTPSDGVDYTTATGTTTITVNAATSATTTTLTSSINPSTVSQVIP